MLKFTLLLLLCTAVISSATPDLFRGCVPRSVNRTARNRCILIPEGELRLNRTYYMLLAEEVLQKSSNQLHKRFLNTVYRITRGATQVNGLCQAQFYLNHGAMVLESSSCKHTG
ncbi:hypothetical protein MTO96_029063 [Rhipicephalus appendiculatus]